MTACFSEHACDRAWERYGLALTPDDMAEIVHLCRTGVGVLMQRGVGGEVFIVRFRDQIVLPVLIRGTSFIVTFQPAHYFRTGERRMRRARKQCPAASQAAVGRVYKRPHDRHLLLREVHE